MTTLSDLDFILRVLRAAWSEDNSVHDELYWRPDERGSVQFFILCNDLFWWGCADAEDLTRKNIHILEEAIKDCKEAERVVGVIHAASLFCCRSRKMRPQGCCYEGIPESLWPLFDACGPERVVDIGNPHPHPKKGGKA